MNKITLPSVEDTIIYVTVGANKELELDIIDVADTWQKCVLEVQDLGGSSSEVIEVFRVKAKDQLGLELSKTSALEFLTFLFSEENRLKKKLSELLGLSDTTESKSKLQSGTSSSLNTSSPTSKQKNSSKAKSRSRRKTSKRSVSSQASRKKKPTQQKTRSS